ncbi:hypothetical protein APUTEX25_001789 [Auxenochlorella protothecoides]|uniref:glutamate--tRNA ligase n=1 Tax=Auxenochlorella protothecoides TaxID=3075 RepID=A0A3M7L5T3_AUXPR|nr:hypothetical protein APUTEX25_001789 [Auxenochlorella protothecoides]|eukprot:RMZ57589.1 hypothetical protein APUTEX25_001789 [Auxenochlorella protothecoides]
MGGCSSPTLVYTERNTPFAVLATARLLRAAINIKTDASLPKDAAPELIFDGGEKLVGTATILRFLARVSRTPDGYYGASPLAASQGDSWIDTSTALVPGLTLEPLAEAISAFLALRTYLVGHSLSLADVAVWGQLQATLQWDKLRKANPALAHLGRWYDHVGSTPALAAVAEALGPRRRFTTPKPTNPELGAAAGGGATGSFDIGLENAEMGKVVTRFPPEPSGYLHIGHAKAALINQHIADMYKGRMLVRFDDTNPSKEKDEYTQSIIADMQRLGLRYAGITYTSDYFEQLAECARRMIAKGYLYADDTPVEQMREERMAGTPSVRRDRPVSETTAIFEEMLVASEEGQRHCLRVKLDMSAPNKALRDPVAYRCNLEPHWRTGQKYKCYPTYDFACPFVDAIEGVTHALRTSEYKDREAQFYMILKLQQDVWPGLPHVTMWDYARLSFIYTVLSKRKLTWFVENGIVDGWDDPRMPTVQGIMRRGLKMEALKEFMLGQGASKNMTYQEWDKIWTINKKLIDPVCPRHTAVEQSNRVLVTLSNGPASPETMSVPKHAKYPPAGEKIQTRTNRIWWDQADAAVVAEGEEVTLMGWGNAIVRKISKREDDTVQSIEAELHLEGDFKKTKLKLTWLADIPELVPLELHHLGYLINKKRLEEDDIFEECVNRNSRTITAAAGDANMAQLQKGDIIQLERKGYFIVDAGVEHGGSVVLLNIPDGRTKNMPGA